MSSVTPTSGTRTFRVAGLAFFVMACVSTVGWLLLRPNPQRLFQKALVAGHRDSAAAERLFRRALESAAGKFPDAQIGLCEALAQRDAWDEAEAVFAETDLSACRSDLLLEFGREALVADRISAAERSLQEVAGRQASERTDALRLLINGYKNWGLQNELIDAAHELTRLEPRDFDAWTILAEVLQAMMMVNECLAVVDEAMRNDPPPEVERAFQYLLVQLLISLGDPERASAELARLHEIEGDSIRVRVCRTDLYRLQGKFEDALASADNLLADRDRQPVAGFIRGCILLDLRRHTDAVSDLEQAVAAQPFNSQAHFKLAEAYRATGRMASALAQSQIAQELFTKRMRINDLLKQRAEARLQDAQTAEQISQLFQDVGDSSAAAHWKRQAALAADRHGPRSSQ